MTVDLSTYNSFRVAATAENVYVFNDISQLPELAEQLSSGKPWLMLGEGSNVLFVNDYAGTVVVNRLRGVTIAANSAANSISQLAANPIEDLAANNSGVDLAADKTVLVTAAAGENWHEFVLQMGQGGYHGLENLALIPGSVGAAPVQNIGAYGVEVADCIHSVTVFDLQTKTTQVFAADDCGFAYRNSHFKRDDWRLRYIIIAVTFQLQRQFRPQLTYQGLQGDTTISTAKQLIDRVIAVRQSKLPDPNILPNAGSFFKNPLVSRGQLQQLQQRYPQMPYFDVDAQQVKIPAAWLLQTAGFKGKTTDSGAGVYEHHALILVNHNGRADGKALWQLAADMIAAVEQQFAITLSPEVRII